MIKKIFFCNIFFHNYPFKEIENKFFKKKLLICAPSGPGLSTLDKDFMYKKSLMNSDINLFDSGFFVLILKLFGINVNKYSGFKFFSNLYKYLNKNKINNFILIDPDIVQSKINNEFLLSVNCVSLFEPYISPKYLKSDVRDYILLSILKSKKPSFVIINLGGGIQEKLGYWLKINLDYNPIIICTGAAIAFYTGQQAKITKFYDKYYLGWLLRCFFNPSVFIFRYLKAFSFLIIFIKHFRKIKIYY